MRINKKIGDVFCYRDSRNERSALSVHKIIPFAELYEKTGIQYSSFNTVYQLFADKESGKLENAKYFLMLPDYFNFRLTGVISQEYTEATTTGMVNAKTHTWDGEILERLGYDKSLFVKLSVPGSAVGNFSDEVKKLVGYDATVIQPATHDTASAVLGAPLDKDSPYISSGTWSLLCVEENLAHTGETAREENYSNEGKVLDIKDTAFVIYDNLARSYADAMTALERITGKKYTTLNIIGGGSQNNFLNKLTAKYTKRNIIAGPSECTALGNLIMQMIGNGEISSISQGRKIIKNSFDIKEITAEI